MAEKPDIAARLADMGSHPEVFTKKELAPTEMSPFRWH
jgi:hypothetical protein